MLINGTVLHDRYRISRQIGCGGMGAVYEALDSRLQNTVAVKQCRLPGLDANRAFEREAKLLASLRHPALPVVIDYFVDGEAQYLVMQFIEGDDLGKLLENRRDRFPSAEVVLWARAVLDALSYLHDHEPPVVHRDIKPSNLRRTPRGEIVLLDFGLAKGRPEEVAMPRPDRSVFGYTLAYSPPEQILRGKTDARSDVYAVGATLYHLLTGRPPVNALDRMRTAESGRPDPLPAAHLVSADVPESLGRLIARAMAVDGAERYASARDMRAALNDCGVDQTTRVNTPEHHGASRRIDVAAPSRAEVGRQIDLLVQVRFATSARLGVEDWPSKARPTEIEQVSEALQLAYPTDPQTGRFLPARLRIKLVAPDFRVDGQADRLIEVPPDEYSKRLAFLLTPLRAASCRINVEVYGLDDLFLGAVPVEIVAVAGAVSEQEICVGNLVLEVVARQVAALLLGARLAAASSPASLAADTGSAAMTMPSPSVPIVERGAASQLVAAAEASARMRETETLSASRSAPSADEEPLPKRQLSRVARVTAPLVVVVFAVAVLLTIRGGRETPEPPVAAPASAPVQTPETGASAAPADALPVATVPMEPPSASTAKGLIAQGNRIGAARAIVGGLKDNPKNSDLIKTLEEILDAAEAEATAAKRSADVVAGASSRSSGAPSQREYADADAQFKSAVSAGASDRSEDKASAVEHYETAAQKYIDAVNSHALAMFKQGNLNGAARAVATGLAAAPGHADLRKTLQEILSGAEASANTAKLAADASGASSRPEYSDGSTRLKSAETSRRSGSSGDEDALRDYVAASQLYTAAVNRHVQGVMKQGNLAGAARAIVAGLGVIPGNREFQKTLQEILDAAEAEATAAKRSADVVAGASSRSDYVNATARLGSAADYKRSGRPGDPEATVREYGAAEKLFRDAAVAPPSPPPPVGVAPIVNTAKSLIAQGNLTGAARAIVGGLKDNPKNSDLTGTIVQLYRAAEAEATNARQAADAAGAKDRPEYADANARLQTARYSSRTAGPENAEAIVREFGAAEDLYRTAAARVKTAPGPDPRAVDELAVRKLLNDYVEAYNSMDVRRVRRFKPSFTDFPKDLSSTELTISDIRIMMPTPDRQTATVTLTAQYRNTYRKGAMPSSSSASALKLAWRAQRKGDAWILLE